MNTRLPRLISLMLVVWPVSLCLATDVGSNSTRIIQAGVGHQGGSVLALFHRVGRGKLIDRTCQFSRIVWVKPTRHGCRPVASSGVRSRNVHD